MIVGILGGGQLARMLALAGRSLGLDFAVLDPAADACAGAVARLIVGRYDDPACLDELAERSDVVTYEFENVPSESVRRLAERVPVFPPVRALEISSDRLAEKRLFAELDIPAARFQCVDSLAQLDAALDAIGLPAVLKTRREGYDGKGQVVIRRREEAAAAYASLPQQAMILEEFLPFDREVSVIAVQGRDGAPICYPLTENHHRGGILRLSVARPDDALHATAEDFATRLLATFDYVGVLALELFVVGGRLLANEIAPRVHNSGHWTIEGAQTSQFENHLRAIVGYPLGEPTVHGHVAMVNFIGDAPSAADVLRHRGVHLHLYGKAPRPGRKVGHATVVAADQADCERVLADLASLRGVELPS
jgi:5-(carboxyamino)imidazole ribonucleotide synthase